MARRSPGEGSIYQRKDGLWVAQYSGKYRYAKTKKLVRVKLLELMTKAEETKPQNITLNTLLDKYMEAAKPNLKPRSIKRYTQAIRTHVENSIGPKKLVQLTVRDVEELYGRMLHSVSPATVNLVHSILSGAYKRGLKWGMVNHNLISDVEPPKLVTEEVEPFTHNEVSRILAAAKFCRQHALWVLALSTGMRHGELLGLQWKDIDFKQGTLRVRRTIYNSVVGTPKSKNSNRTIALPQRAIDALKNHKSGSDTWVFTNKVGKTISSSGFHISYWKPLLLRAEVEYKNFHTCRHYVSSTLLKKGVPIMAVAKMLGHDQTTLLRTYAHFMPDMRELTARAMDDVLSEPQN